MTLTDIFESWDGCMYDGIDIGAALRADFAKLSPATPAPAATGATTDQRVTPWHERLLRNGNMGNEHVFMEAEIADLRAALAAKSAATGAQQAGELTDEQSSALWDIVQRIVEKANNEANFRFCGTTKHSLATLLERAGKAACANAANELHALLAATPAAPTVPGATAAAAGFPDGWKVERVGANIHLKRADGRWCGYSLDIDSPAHRLTYEFMNSLLSASGQEGATADASDARDAARWRAFVGSQRIKPQGSAGLNEPMANNYAHMGLEIWTTYDRDYSPELLKRMDYENAMGREWLTKYADIAIKAMAGAAS